jgi:hypothetical protein
MGAVACENEDHERHLCQFIAREEPISVIKPLVRRAQFICRYCGRAAAEEERLCRPEPLE